MKKQEGKQAIKKATKAVAILSAKGGVCKTGLTSAITSRSDKKIQVVSYDSMNRVLPGTEPVQIENAAKLVRDIEMAKKGVDVALFDIGASEYPVLLGIADSDDLALSDFDSFVIPSLDNSLDETEDTIADLIAANVSPDKIKVIPCRVSILNKRTRVVDLKPFDDLFKMCKAVEVSCLPDYYLMDNFGIGESLKQGYTFADALAMDALELRNEWKTINSDLSAKRKDVEKALNKYRMVASILAYDRKQQFKDTIEWIVG